MFSLLLGITAASALAAAQAPATAPADRTLASLPNTTIKYYEVTGKNGKAIQKSIEKQRRQKGSDNVSAASTGWNIDASVRKRTEGTTCTIVGAEAKFTGLVELPKLANEETVPAAILEDWRTFTAGLEKSAAADLWFVHDRMALVEKAILASTCDGANAAAAAAIEEIKTQEAAFRQQNAAAAESKSNDDDRPERDRIEPRDY